MVDKATVKNFDYSHIAAALEHSGFELNTSSWGGITQSPEIVAAALGMKELAKHGIGEQAEHEAAKGNRATAIQTATDRMNATKDGALRVDLARLISSLATAPVGDIDRIIAAMDACLDAADNQSMAQNNGGAMTQEEKAMMAATDKILEFAKSDDKVAAQLETEWGVTFKPEHKKAHKDAEQQLKDDEARIAAINKYIAEHPNLDAQVKEKLENAKDKVLEDMSSNNHKLANSTKDMSQEAHDQCKHKPGAKPLVDTLENNGKGEEDAAKLFDDMLKERHAKRHPATSQGQSNQQQPTTQQTGNDQQPVAQQPTPAPKLSSFSMADVDGGSDVSSASKPVDPKIAALTAQINNANMSHPSDGFTPSPGGGKPVSGPVSQIG